MAKTVALIGKIGPAFGDGRASHVEMEYMESDPRDNGVFYIDEDMTYISKIANWRNGERAETLRAAFDQAAAQHLSPIPRNRV